MRIENGKFVFEKKNCYCNNGQEAKKISCPTCNGTGNGKRGGRRKCKSCFGSRIKYSTTETVTCNSCKGNYINFEPENCCDYIKSEDWKNFKFVVYHNATMTGLESLLGLGCVFSSIGGNYNIPDEQIIEEVKNHNNGKGVQAISVSKEIKSSPNSERIFEVCDHIGIFVHKNRTDLKVKPVFKQSA